MRELLRGDTARICIFSRDEYKQFEMREAIPDPNKRLRFFIGDVRDKTRIWRAMHGVTHVIHAAAMKQVKASEFNPFEAVQTNVIGAQNVMEAALDAKVEKVLAISTDKAVNPTTLYGATKFCAERMFTAGNSYAGGGPTLFAVVRFGNIAYSRGSVIPRWKRILASGVRVVPVSDPECTRYWITAEEAARYVIEKMSRSKAGEIWTPLMPAFRLADLAIAMGASMHITGLAPGERLHEAGSDTAPRLTIGELRGLIG